MDLPQIILPAAVGLAASVVTAVVTHVLTRARERKKHEREVAEKLAEERRRLEREIAAKLADLNSADPDVTRAVAMQFAHACFIVEPPGGAERERVFLPMGSRITLGRSGENQIRIDDAHLSRVHASFRAQGLSVHIEPLDPTCGVEVNGAPITEPTELGLGDVITVPGSTAKITFVPMVT